MFRLFNKRKYVTSCCPLKALITVDWSWNYKELKYKVLRNYHLKNKGSGFTLWVQMQRVDYADIKINYLSSL